MSPARLVVCASLLFAGGCCELGSAVGTRPAPEAPSDPLALAPSASSVPEPVAEAVVVAPPTAEEPSLEAPVEPSEAPSIERDVSSAELETWRAAPGGILGRTELATASGETGDGVRLFGIRAEDPMAALGFQNGDIVHSLNEMSIGDEEQLRGAFEQLRVTSYYRAEIIRRGTPETLLVHVRE